jgi:DNA-binding Lrp family transcriptional regulator
MQQDASLTNHELAQRVHASAPTCMRRVKRLIEEGVIARQVAILAPEKVGAGLTAIVEITLDQQATERLTSLNRGSPRARRTTVLPGVTGTGFYSDYSGRGYDGISCAGASACLRPKAISETSEVSFQFCAVNLKPELRSSQESDLMSVKYRVDGYYLSEILFVITLKAFPDQTIIAARSKISCKTCTSAALMIS